MPDVERATERTHLVPRLAPDKRLGAVQQDADAESTISSYVTKEEQLLSATSIGERLPYNDYTTIDWLHDLVSYVRTYMTHSRPTSTGQGLLSSAFCSRPQRSARSPCLRLRIRSRMDRCGTHRRAHSLCGFLCRHRRGHRQRLETRILQGQRLFQQRQLLHESASARHSQGESRRNLRRLAHVDQRLLESFRNFRWICFGIRYHQRIVHHAHQIDIANHCPRSRR